MKIYACLIKFLLFLVTSGAIDDWALQPKNIKFAHNWETTPFQIKTSASKEYRVYMEDSAGSDAGRVYLDLAIMSSPKYQLSKCMEDPAKFDTPLPSAIEKVWTIIKIRGGSALDDVRVIVLCNDLKVMDFSFTSCDERDNNKNRWLKMTDKMVFSEDTYFRKEDWKLVTRDSDINYDLESASLQIKAHYGIGDKLKVYFPTTAGSEAAGLHIDFMNEVYRILACNNGAITITNLPTGDVKIFKITKSTTPELRITVLCNGVEILNKPLSGSECDDSDWKVWEENMNKIKFKTSEDDASLFYKATGKCEPQYNDAQNKITQTPNVAVEEGTEVTLSCSKPKLYTLMGTKHLTCLAEDVWSTPSTAPTCRKCGKLFNSYPELMSKLS